ncbi:MAG: hypothetical protein QOI46_4679, partial [Alphaproteobacteria bacterium]|nr:hypothetical protein [Alphaproteobacteria bacterium]
SYERSSCPGSIAQLSAIVRDCQDFGWPNLRESAGNRIDRFSHRFGRILSLRLDRANDLHRVRTPNCDLYGGRLVQIRLRDLAPQSPKVVSV